MAEHCWHGGPWYTWPNGVERCKEPPVRNLIYCEQHYRETMERVAMVSPVVATGLHWSGAVAGSQLGIRGQWRTA